MNANPNNETLKHKVTSALSSETHLLKVCLACMVNNQPAPAHPIFWVWWYVPSNLCGCNLFLSPSSSLSSYASSSLCVVFLPSLPFISLLIYLSFVALINLHVTILTVYSGLHLKLNLKNIAIQKENGIWNVVFMLWVFFSHNSILSLFSFFFILSHFTCPGTAALWPHPYIFLFIASIAIGCWFLFNSKSKLYRKIIIWN